MDISITRRNGFFKNAFGSRLPLSVYFNGQLITRLATGETQELQLPEEEGELLVGMSSADLGIYRSFDKQAVQVQRPVVSSQPYRLLPTDAPRSYSVRTRAWVVWDFMDLALIRPLCSRVFVIEEVLESSMP
ncbi:hypothetical protein [Pseudomonas sp. HS6]|uniref:hypothetical protein n=1 Tax=Pseudomonas sp. HS6 TaxID=2850559 RepID=UPI00201842DF|nr:hypothetical protein [Pseudomonas sp. HS6]UQS17734.1 hypothetical protein JJN09_12995 [Pseudomonas sp. HS6]